MVTLKKYIIDEMGKMKEWRRKIYEFHLSCVDFTFFIYYKLNAFMLHSIFFIISCCMNWVRWLYEWMNLLCLLNVYITYIYWWCFNGILNGILWIFYYAIPMCMLRRYLMNLELELKVLWIKGGEGGSDPIG